MTTRVSPPVVPRAGETLVHRGGLVDRQGQGLGGVGLYPVGGAERERVGAAGARGTGCRIASPSRSGLPAKVTPEGKVPVSRIDAVGLPVVVTVKVPARAGGEGGGVGAGDRGGLVDRQGKGLGGVGLYPVGGAERERVGAAGARVRGAG